SDNIKEEYEYNSKLNSELHFNYKHKDIYNTAEKDGKQIGCYGYCFDVRNPKSYVKETLIEIIKNIESFYENIKYLNRHYIIFSNFDSNWKLVIGAVCVTPVYFDKENRFVTTEKSNESQSMHGLTILDLSDFIISRIE